MNTIDKVAHIIDEWTQEGYELNCSVGNPHAIAERLAQAGLLAPDLPEPVDKKDKTAWWEPCGPEYAVSVYNEPLTGRRLVGIDDAPYALEPEEAQNFALAVLAASTYKKGNHHD